MVWQISRGLMTKILIWIIRSLISTIRMLPDLLLASITSQRMLSDSGPKGSSQSVSMVAWKFRSRFSMSGRVAAVPKRPWNKSSRLVGTTPSLVCGYKGNHFFSWINPHDPHEKTHSGTHRSKSVFSLGVNSQWVCIGNGCCFNTMWGKQHIP